MAYSLNPDELPGEGIRRIACEQVDKALDALEDGEDMHVAVHEARKRFKKVRAALRLVRSDIGEDVYKQENACYRDAGRALAGLRDSQAVIETLKGLRDHYGDHVFARPFESMIKGFRARRAELTLEQSRAVDKVAEDITAARARIDAWPVTSRGWNAFDGGIQKIYAKGGKAFQKAYDSEKSADFHDWRKQVKYLWHSLRIVRPIWSGPLTGFTNEAGVLADLLGGDHDMADLITALSRPRPAQADAGEAEVIIGLALQRSRQLRAQARPIGLRLYAEQPDQFAARLGCYWQALNMEQALLPAVA